MFFFFCVPLSEGKFFVLFDKVKSEMRLMLFNKIGKCNGCRKM